MGVSSDEQVSFTCQARAVPAASIRWNYTSVSEDRVEIQTVVDNSTNITTSTLTLSEVAFVDTGSFVCTASNGLDPQDSVEADLTVYGESRSPGLACWTLSTVREGLAR